MTDHQRVLPRIGSPASRALAAVGITRLEQLQDHRAEDLLALHGAGPETFVQLEAALAENGMSFLAESRRHELTRWRNATRGGSVADTELRQASRVP